MIDRRMFLASPLAAMLPSVEKDSEVSYPWDARAEELFEEEGHYCHYAAFIEWLHERYIDAWGNEKDWKDRIDLETVGLYIIFCDLIEEMQYTINRRNVAGDIPSPTHVDRRYPL